MTQGADIELREPQPAQTYPSTNKVVRAVGLRTLVDTGFSEQVELALWRRPVPPGLDTAFLEQDFSGFMEFRVDGTGAEVLSQMQSFLAAQDWDQRICDVVYTDALAIVEASSASGPDYTVRLEYVTDDACRKFHKDQTDIRLITTYMGRGSQWILVDEAASEPEIQEMLPFEVGMFLGERSEALEGVFHRSPPIEHTSMCKRFMMVVDVERPGFC